MELIKIELTYNLIIPNFALFSFQLILFTRQEKKEFFFFYHKKETKNKKIKEKERKNENKITRV